MDKTSLGDRMKMYERKREERFIPLIPIVARLDGRAFHSFCRGMDRPFDVAMSNCMLQAAKYVFEATGANIAYTQSDEISLLFYSDNVKSQVFFDGRVQKMVSNLTAEVMSEFMLQAINAWGQEMVRKKRPRFDCRVWQLPMEEVHNYFRWRVRDAIKNSVSMAASAYYSHKELEGKNGSERHDMLHAKGVNWDKYPQHFKEGTFIQKREVFVAVDDERMMDIPKQYRAQAVGKRRMTTFVEDFQGDGFESTTNMEGFLFRGEQPQTTFPLQITPEAEEMLRQFWPPGQKKR